MNLLAHSLIIGLMILFALGYAELDMESARQAGGAAIFVLGFVLLSAFVFARIINILSLPLISGYIFAGILAGPFVSGFLTTAMIGKLSLINDLALSFIALNAGAELHLASIRKRSRAILAGVLLLTAVIMAVIPLFIVAAGGYFGLLSSMGMRSLVVFAVLTGLLCVSLSPASVIALINECRAKGPFTEIILAVTIAIDAVIIMAFTTAISVFRMMLYGGGPDLLRLAGTGVEMLISVAVGIMLGKGIALYQERIGHDFLLFLLFIAFAVSKVSVWLIGYMHGHFNISLHLEPLLICMSAGYFVRNHSSSGHELIRVLTKNSLPIYVLFFTLAGASLDFTALGAAWSLALAVAAIRIAALFAGSFLAATISRDPPAFRKNAWMAYITQAGVSIGLAQLAARQLPEIGVSLTTVVLAVIAVNQVIGPVAFKMALGYVGETGKR